MRRRVVGASGQSLPKALTGIWRRGCSKQASLVKTERRVGRIVGTILKEGGGWSSLEGFRDETAVEKHVEPERKGAILEQGTSKAGHG